MAKKILVLGDSLRGNSSTLLEDLEALFGLVKKNLIVGWSGSYSLYSLLSMGPYYNNINII